MMIVLNSLHIILIIKLDVIKLDVIKLDVIKYIKIIYFILYIVNDY